MATHHLEVERKYELTDPQADIAPIDWNVLENLEVSENITEHLEATYFDTQDADLGRNMVALRRRLGGYDQGWHIKFDDRAGARHEIGFPLLADRQRMPAAVHKFVRAVTLGDELYETVSLLTERERTVLVDAEGTKVAEICKDKVRALDFSTNIERSWTEWEVELLDAGLVSPADIFTACEVIFTNLGIALSQSTAKIARALGKDECFEARRQGLEGCTSEKSSTPSRSSKKKSKKKTSRPKSSQKFLRQILHSLTSDLMIWEMKLRSDAPDAVHGMRKSARQVEAILRYAVLPYISDDTSCQKVQDDIRYLKHLMGGLASARDIEILTTFMWSVDTHPGLITETARRELDEYLSSDSEVASKVLIRVLDSPEYLQLRKDLVYLMNNLKQLVQLPEDSDEYTRKVSQHLRKVLRTYVGQEYRHVWKPSTEDVASDEQRDTLLFKIRRAGQGAKYCLDAFESAGMPLNTSEQKLWRICDGFYDSLSILSDEKVIATWLEATLRRATRRQNDRLAIGYLLGGCDARIVQLRAKEISRIPELMLELKKLKFKKKS
ncbi:CYTH domain-containing protein [Rothia sp. P6271]|uniref:CYTH and CHAD domain-containing protein n=1 Tax=Rothia sp. P6271 TaxID=3402659 RepID=UPI003ACDE1A7